MPQSRKIRFLAGVGAVATAALTFGAGPANAAEGEVRALGAPDAVPGSYIVKLAAGGAGSQTADFSTERINTLASRFDAKVERVFDTALKGFSANLSEQQAKRLAADPSVEYVEQDQVVHASATQANPPSWGLDRIDQANLPLSKSYTYASTGAGVNVYVVDTGVRISHQQFGGRAKNGYDFVDNDPIAQDGYGHGTHVAATIAGSTYGVAKGATVYGVRVLDNSGSGTTAGVIAGVDWVTKNAVKPAVANLSLGGGVQTSLDDAVRKSIASGVTYSIAAGNSNANANTFSPARVAEAITVGATTNTDARASYSNWGPVVDIFAPGSTITSAWNTNDTATYTGNGTSFAAPHVAGAAARYLQAHKTATPAQVSAALVTASTKNKVTNPGTGSPNRLLYSAPTS
jgi:subtilisin family serine protease